MRTTTAGELTVLAATDRQVTYRVKVENGSGTMIDLTSWVDHVAWDMDIDQPVAGASIYFIRADGPTKSLSPLRSDSTLNLKDDLVTISAQLDVGRKLTLEVATTAVGVAIVAGDYKLMFSGVIDAVNFEDNPIAVTCRDDGGLLVDRWVGAEWPSYQEFDIRGTGAGRDVELVMQDILDDAVNAGSILPVSPSVTLNTPVSPSALITEYKQQNQSVMDALQALASVPGWDVRYKYDDTSGTFLLTFSEPDRAKTTPDYTFGPGQYFQVSRLNIDRTKVRNFLDLHFTTTTGGRDRQLLGDTTSQSRYGLQYMRIDEADDSPINTTTEALAKLTAMLADLKDPKAEQEIELHFFWPVELGDLIRHSPNAVHYNANQDYAVVRIEHELGPGRHRTRLLTRGSPAGAHVNWLQPPRPLPLPSLSRVQNASTGALLVDPAVGRFRVRTWHSANPSISSATATALPWDSEIFDVGSLHSTSVSNTRITVPAGGETGLWLISAQVQWDTNTTGMREVKIRKNGSSDLAVSRHGPIAGQLVHTVIATDNSPTAGDYYEAVVTQDSGGARTVTGAASNFAAVAIW